MWIRFQEYVRAVPGVGAGVPRSYRSHPDLAVHPVWMVVHRIW